jgi:hypothetical protein
MFITFFIPEAFNVLKQEEYYDFKERGIFFCYKKRFLPI